MSPEGTIVPGELSNIFSISTTCTGVKNTTVGDFLESPTQTVSNIRRQHRCSRKKAANSFVANIARCQKKPLWLYKPV